ncbi:hypothetical protein B0H10DRAFT_1939599 [Mycena sp. CBHHK59/15]|nr:hypothetical protein B0H10DRAFT_1939599 [Mycena sp. CBHHK59/15]
MSTAHLESVQNLLLAVQARCAASGLDSLPGSDDADPFPSALVPQRRSREDDNDEDDPAGTGGGAAGPHPPAGEFDEILFTLEAGRAYKKQKKLSPESDLVCEEFLKSNNPFKHQFIQLTVSLQIRDLLKGMSQDVDGKTWVMPAALKTTASDYARAAVLSQSARTYRGKSFAAAVMTALREHNVSDLPPASDTGCCETVSEAVGSVLTQTQHSIKVVLTESISKKTDIANVTQKCIARSKAKATAALYRRMAWLTPKLTRTTWKQQQLVKQNAKPQADTVTEKDKDKDFWVNVDKGLDKLHKAFPDKVDLDCAFSMIYDVDIQLYGPPDSKIRVTAANGVDGWLNTLDKETSLAAN